MSEVTPDLRETVRERGTREALVRWLSGRDCVTGELEFSPVR